MRAESATMSLGPRTLPAWRAPEPQNQIVCRGDGRRRRRTSAPAGARVTTRPRSTSASRRRPLSGDDAVVEPYEIAEPFVNGDAAPHGRGASTGRSRSSSRHRRTSRASSTRKSSSATACPSSYVEYLQLLTDVFAECARKLEPGGRIAVNVANLGRKPYRSLAADVIHILQDDLQAAAARRGRLAQGRRRGRQLRVGLVPQRGQPGAARHHRARRDREQGSLRPRAEPAPIASAAACRRRTRSTPTSSWPPRSTCGTSSPRARAASRIRRRSPSGCPAG